MLNKKHELYLLFPVMPKNRNPVNLLCWNLGNAVFPEIYKNYELCRNGHEPIGFTPEP